ncbi:hypothetical protein ACFE04_003304 [Oxalis oulophora]
MSSGTPVGGGGYMRQRHSQGYASGSDDLEEDACSRPNPFSDALPRNRTWLENLENVLWIASALFVVYYGDRHFNLVYLLWHDQRIRRMPLYFGMAGVSLNIMIFFYTSMISWSVRRFDEKWELSSLSALPYVTLLGLASFCFHGNCLTAVYIAAVYTLHGRHGCIATCYDREIQTTELASVGIMMKFYSHRGGGSHSNVGLIGEELW